MKLILNLTVTMGLFWNAAVWAHGETSNCSSSSGTAPDPSHSGMVGGGCGIGSPTQGQEAISTQGTHLKGWYLHCWKESGSWNFSLTQGTNALPYKEKLRQASFRGVSELKRRLAKLESGESILLNPHPVEGVSLKRPPQPVLKEIQALCAKRNLRLDL